ncbi:lumican-like [Eucyclogobius newberryi]|uniref:lumican n=1 Tax=Eucyclogobius newberryi TaxID=166745 RepID=UPI003B5C2B52
MALWFCLAPFLLSLLCPAWSTTAEDMDYGGVPLWIDRVLGEPSVMSLQGRSLGSSWFRATNPAPCPTQCECPIQWPTAVYCDHRGLDHAPETLPDRTQYLFLQGNNVSSLSSSTLLSNVSGLRWLIVDNNLLKTLDQDLLQNQTKLWYLFANHNRLESAPGGLPEGLRQLRLAHNRISTIGAGVFSRLHSLTVLLLQGNRLKAVSEGHVSGLLSVTLLDLSGNLFKTVPQHLPPSVQQLYLSNNSFSSLEQDSFSSYSHLKYLRLGHCDLQSPSVHHDTFNLFSLLELDLSYNKLTTTPTVPPTLLHLYLEANHIQEFNVSSFCRDEGPGSYSRLRILRLEGNRIRPHELPPDWVHCLRVLQHLYI